MVFSVISPFGTSHSAVISNLDAQVANLVVQINGLQAQDIQRQQEIAVLQAQDTEKQQEIAVLQAEVVDLRGAINAYLNGHNC